ncbi:MAG: hypothetical protein Q8Q02_11265 [Nocardioides sp.]|nr:hypothetical protein [Nocardioides sp.]
MPRFLIGWLLGLGGATAGLVVSALLFEGFDLHADGLVGALVIFGVLTAVLPYFILKALLRRAGSVIALSGLLATFLALLVTDLVSSGLTVRGLETWFGSTLLIWLLSMFIWVLPGPWRTFKKRDRTPA